MFDDSARGKTLSSALILLTEKGFHSVSIHDIRKHAGVSTGAIYHHFGNKDEIAKTLFTEVLEHMTEQMDDILLEEPTTYARIKAVYAMAANMVNTQPELTRFIIKQAHREFLPDEKPLCVSEPFLRMKTIVQYGIKKGDIAPMDIWVALSLTFGSLLRLIEYQLDGVLEKTADNYIDELLQHAWKSITQED